MTFVQATFVLETFVLETFVHISCWPQNFVSPKFFWHNKFLDQHFFGDICPYQQYLSSYWPDFDKKFWATFFCYQNFWGPKIFWTLIFWPNILLYQHRFWANFFLIKSIFASNFFCGQWYLKNNYHNHQIKNIPNNNNIYYYYNYYTITILNRFQLSLKPKSIQWVVTSKQLNLVCCCCCCII